MWSLSYNQRGNRGSCEMGGGWRGDLAAEMSPVPGGWSRQLKVSLCCSERCTFKPLHHRVLGLSMWYFEWLNRGLETAGSEAAGGGARLPMCSEVQEALL